MILRVPARKGSGVGCLFTRVSVVVWHFNILYCLNAMYITCLVKDFDITMCSPIQTAIYNLLTFVKLLLGP